MGIPKFFRWVSERYPCLNELVSEHQIPEFDNLYLDMNGIIHACSHPNDFDPHFRINEKKIFKDIFSYIEILFCIIKPKKLFFLAVDGVAPRAKMNQQRGRRFRSAKEAELLELRALNKGEELPMESRFDSNCITPGTEFMAKLDEQLKYFVAHKMSTDKLWQKPCIILSGHETPGEGEHKIMDYIRYLKSKPDYCPTTSHCLYGLDADLMMLGLCTHEPYFCLLREEVNFCKRQQRMSSPAETRFFLLQLSLFRDYLDHEFSELKSKLKFPYNLESIINDWVLMCFLVGNDFIPNLPGLHINSGALPMLYQAYKDVLPTLDGYINEYGYLNLPRFQSFMDRLSLFDREQFEEKNADLKYFEGKGTHYPVYGKNAISNGKQDCEQDVDGARSNGTQNSDLAALINRTEDLLLESERDDEDENCLSGVFNLESDSEDGDDLMSLEFKQHKKDYYMNKLGFHKVTPVVMKSQAEGYVRAIQWNLHYYYHGICSWSWFYPHHYAPFISDIRDFAGINLDFDEGKPFLPYQQLLAVLPAASKELLPLAYRKLMVNCNSPIIDYYPSNFETDLNGKRQEWEAVVLIPFIDETKLLQVMAKYEEDLTREEQQRNSHGPMVQYDYSPHSQGRYEGTQFFPVIANSYAKITLIDRKDILVPRTSLVMGLCPGYNPDLYIPGFFTLRHIPHKGHLKMAKVLVFDRCSQQESMVLTLMTQDMNQLSLAQVAEKLLGKTIFVNYPHLVEARVVAVCNKRMKFIENPANETYKIEEFKGPQNQFTSDKKSITENYKSRLAIDIGETHIILYAQTLVGRKYTFTAQGKVNLEKQWSNMPQGFALQATVEHLETPMPEYPQYDSIQEIFTPGSISFMISHPMYGAKCKVISYDKFKPSFVNVEAIEPWDPPLHEVQNALQAKRDTYITSSAAAQQLRMTPHMFSSVTGAIIISTSFRFDVKKSNIGLNLKFTSRNEEVPGYTKKSDGVWLYSQKTVQLVKDYSESFPALFQLLSQKRRYCDEYNNVFHQDVFFPPDRQERLNDVLQWLRRQPYTQLDRQKCGSEILEGRLVRLVEEIISKPHLPTLIKFSRMQVMVQNLYKPGTTFGNLIPDSTSLYQLFDRVVNVRDNFTVPLGLQGTVIGVHPTEDMMDVMFDEPFKGGMPLNCLFDRGYRMSRNSLINISHGKRNDQADPRQRQGSSRPRSAFVNCRKDSDNALPSQHDPAGKSVVSKVWECPGPPAASSSSSAAAAVQREQPLNWRQPEDRPTTTENMAVNVMMQKPSNLTDKIHACKFEEEHLLSQITRFNNEELANVPSEYLKERVSQLVSCNIQRARAWFNLKQWARMESNELLSNISALEELYPVTTKLANIMDINSLGIKNVLQLELAEKRKERKWLELEQVLSLTEPILYNKLQSIMQVTLPKSETSSEQQSGSQGEVGSGQRMAAAMLQGKAADMQTLATKLQTLPISHEADSTETPEMSTSLLRQVLGLKEDNNQALEFRASSLPTSTCQNLPPLPSSMFNTPSPVQMFFQNARIAAKMTSAPELTPQVKPEEQSLPTAMLGEVKTELKPDMTQSKPMMSQAEAMMAEPNRMTTQTMTQALQPEQSLPDYIMQNPQNFSYKFTMMLLERGHGIPDFTLEQVPGPMFKAQVMVPGHGFIEGQAGAQRGDAIENVSRAAIHILEKMQKPCIPPTELPPPPEKWFSVGGVAPPQPSMPPWNRPPPFGNQQQSGPPTQQLPSMAINQLQAQLQAQRVAQFQARHHSRFQAQFQEHLKAQFQAQMKAQILRNSQQHFSQQQHNFIQTKPRLDHQFFMRRFEQGPPQRPFLQARIFRPPAPRNIVQPASPGMVTGPLPFVPHAVLQRVRANEKSFPVPEIEGLPPSADEKSKNFLERNIFPPPPECLPSPEGFPHLSSPPQLPTPAPQPKVTAETQAAKVLIPVDTVPHATPTSPQSIPQPPMRKSRLAIRFPTPPP